MEEYEGIENDASEATATTTTPGGQVHEVLSQAGQIRHEVVRESERSRLGNAGVLKATSGDATKGLKSRTTIRTGKSTKAVIKQFTTQELQAEKGKMQEWKDMVMQEVGRELQVIRQVQEGAIEVQRQGFQRELERVREIFESKSAASENEIRLLKALRQHPAQKMSPANGNSTTSSNGQDEGERSQPEEREGTQEFQHMETYKINASPPRQPKQNRSGVSRKVMHK